MKLFVHAAILTAALFWTPPIVFVVAAIAITIYWDFLN